MSGAHTSARAIVAAIVMLCAVALAATAQVAPNEHWRTIRTQHFRVHFTRALEIPARRAAASAEDAYAQLAHRLKPPRGPIDLVVADNVDFSNGFTTPFPTNRIIVYAHPPLDSPELRYFDDWLALVTTHELTHAFHLDRADGWWGVAQHIFGRAPFLFPNQYAPGWVIEGLATFYESDVTGVGRVAGTYERMVVESTAQRGAFLPIGSWNLSSTRYPGGDVAYGYGALFFDYLARTRGEDKVGKFVDASSRAVLPFTLNHVAANTFGVSFTRAWREWRDTLRAHVEAPRPPLAGWRDLTRQGRLVVFPRWYDDDSLLFVGSDWRSTAGAYDVDLGGRRDRVGRRNSVDRNVPLADGSIVFTQLEQLDPYHVRSDLYREKGGDVERLTHGARVAEVDARRDGAIIGVRFGDATTQLVRISPDGATIVPITSRSLDTAWAEPRWSPRGDRIAATRWTRGGYADIVVLDTLGRLLRELTHDRAFDASPDWTPDGSSIVFSSDRTGITDVYIAPADRDGPPVRLSHAVTGLFYPQLSPHGDTLAAIRWDADGWHLGVAPLDASRADTPAVAASFDEPPPPAPASVDSPSTGYSPWRTLVPRYWLPLIGQNTTGGYTVGAFTSGNDVVGRHSYYADALIDPQHGEHALDASWQYAGLGQPVLGLAASQYWDRFTVVDTTGARLGDLRRRTRSLALGLTVVRPRVRTYAWATLGGRLEQRAYSTEPAPLLGELNRFYQSNPRYWTATLSSGWTNAQTPVRAISPEDGISLAGSGELRWLEGGGALQQKLASVSLSAYKSLDFGGFAHHVIAARAAAGVSGGVDPDEWEVGGASGANVSLLPGVSVGSRRTFGVRGFPAGVESGRRALTGSLEYRVPLAAPSRGAGLWPFFLDRTSLSLFADGGSAWGGFATPGGIADHWIASAGAELGANLGVQYDVPYLLRVGVAFPLVNRSLVRVSTASVYVRLGYSF